MQFLKIETTIHRCDGRAHTFPLSVIILKLNFNFGIEGNPTLFRWVMLSKLSIFYKCFSLCSMVWISFNFRSLCEGRSLFFMTFVTGFMMGSEGMLNSKLFTLRSLHNPNWNKLKNVASPNEISQSNCLKFDVYIITKCDYWEVYCILILDLHPLFEFSKGGIKLFKDCFKVVQYR